MAQATTAASNLDRLAGTVAYPSKTTGWVTTIVLFLLTVIAMADRMAISMLISPIKADFGIGDFKASLLVGMAFVLFYTIALLPIGWAADRYSRRRILTVCLIVWSLASMACGLATGFVMLFIMRMMIGVGEAGIGPASHGIIGASFPRDQLAKPLALQGMGMQIGGAGGIAAAGAILSAGAAGAFTGLPWVGDLAPWRLAFIFIGLPGLVALVLIPLIHDSKAGSQPLAADTVRPVSVIPFLRANPRLAGLVLLAAGTSAMGFGSISAWSPEILQRIYLMEPAQAGAAFGGVVLSAAILSQAVYSVTTDWFARRGALDAPIRVGLLPIILSLPVAFFTYRAADAGAFLAWQFALLCCVVPCGGLANTCVQQIAPPELRSRLSAIMILIISILGFGLGPALSGWLSEYVFGEQQLRTAVSIVLIGGMTITLLMLLVVQRPLRDYTAAREERSA